MTAGLFIQLHSEPVDSTQERLPEEGGVSDGWMVFLRPASQRERRANLPLAEGIVGLTQALDVDRFCLGGS